MAPRGIRNNNPLNIRKGNTWKGEITGQTDNAFEQYESMAYGIRAGFIILRNYITGHNGRKRRYNTVDKIIRRWAPPTENATQKYIDYVSSSMKVHPLTILDFRNRRQMVDLVDAMIQVECGRHVDRDLIDSAYDMI